VIATKRDGAGVTDVAFTPEPRELQVLRSPGPAHGPRLPTPDQVLAAQDRYIEMTTDLGASDEDLRRALLAANQTLRARFLGRQPEPELEEPEA
jgi:hypothetical protein